MIAALLIIVAAGHPIAQKDIRVEPKGCHLPVVAGEWPQDGEWRKATFKIVCKRASGARQK